MGGYSGSYSELMQTDPISDVTKAAEARDGHVKPLAQVKKGKV